MTSDQSKKLKVGTCVCFDGDKVDRGTVTANHAQYITIKWDDGHKSSSGHKEMKRIDPLAAKR